MEIQTKPSAKSLKQPTTHTLQLTASLNPSCHAGLDPWFDRLTTLSVVEGASSKGYQLSANGYFWIPFSKGMTMGKKGLSAKLQMTMQKFYFSGKAASYNILEQNVILDPRFLEDDKRL